MSGSSSYALFQYVGRFLQQHYPRHSRHVAVAVSGGVDSLLLLACANYLLKRGQLDSVRALTVDHNTRPGQAEETRRVKFQAECWELSCEILTLTQEAPTADVENVLRQRRHELLKAALTQNEELWMGHQLNDSWEWSQLQAARSGDVLSALGIPLKSGRIVRPFLCVTRRQIEHFARMNGIRWTNDPTNRDLRFERNWIRQKWIYPLRRRHPQFLKHYARRSQKLAELLGVSLRKKKAFSSGAVNTAPWSEADSASISSPS